MRIKRSTTTNSPDTPTNPATLIRPLRAASAHGTTHLYRNRHGTYYFRVRIQGGEYKRSLGTKDPVAATMLASRLNYRLGMNFKDDSELIAGILAKAAAKKLGKFDVALPNGTRLEKIDSEAEVRNAVQFLRDMKVENLSALEPEEHRGRVGVSPSLAAATVPTPSTPKLLAAVEPYLTLKAHEGENETKTINEKRATYKRFVSVVGDLEVGQITKEHANAFRLQLVKEKLSTVRINKLLSYLRDFMNDAMVSITGVNSNPFEANSLSKDEKKKQRQKGTSYQAFTGEDLALIFEPSAYKTYCFRKRHYYWMPLLCLCSGARPDEIAALPLSAAMVVEGVDVLDIQKAKNVQSIRKIPIHQALIDNGFLDYVKDLRQRGETQLFPGLTEGPNGYIKNVSRRFNQGHLDKIGITNARKRLYSFRATFITRLTWLNWHPVLVMAVVGHYDQDNLDLSQPHFKNYQGRAQDAGSMVALREVVNSFDMVPLIAELTI